MRTPPFLIAAALLFWGWQTGYLLLGAIAGAVLESSRWISFRWSLTATDFNRLWNVCTVLFLGAGTFLVVNEGSVSMNDFFVDAGRRPEAIKQAGKAALTWFQWFPLIFLPFLVAQVFNEVPEVARSTFSWWLRRQEQRNGVPSGPGDTINVSWPYFALCLLATSAVTQKNPFFYFGLVALVGWALWVNRTRRYPLLAWLGAFVIWSSLGYGGQHGLAVLQQRLEQMNLPFLSRFNAEGFNPKESRTRLGSVGRIQMSDQIVLRLETDGRGAPDLLREASYPVYSTLSWRVGKNEFSSVPSEADLSTWIFMTRRANRRTLNIAGYFPRGEGLLPLPHGSLEVNELAVGDVQTNSFGAARMKGGPGLALYNAVYDGGLTFGTAPGPDDLLTYDSAEPSVGTVAGELGLQPALPPKEAMKRVATYFAEQFQYASYLGEEHEARTNQTALARFLLHTRSGHCEYFATATTLLLRRAGLPTRYAVGYAVQEGSGRKYIVRGRHAHAWTLVYHDGAWHNFDTTPGSWLGAENQRRSWLQPLKDFFSDLWFQFSKLRWGKTEWRKYLMLAPIPLLIIVVVRLFFGRQWKRARRRRQLAAEESARPGLDSEFYQIERRLAERGLTRLPEETWAEWFRRLGLAGEELARLRPILELHQRHRFDPKGLGPVDRERLTRAVSSWLGQR